MNAAAVEDCTEALVLDPGSVAARSALGNAHLRQGNVDAAIHECSRAIRTLQGLLDEDEMEQIKAARKKARKKTGAATSKGKKGRDGKSKTTQASRLKAAANSLKVSGLIKKLRKEITEEGKKLKVPEKG